MVIRSSLLFSGAIVFGTTLSLWMPYTAIVRSDEYLYVIHTLLAIGLYGSVYAINLDELRKSIPIIIQAVTIGVLLKVIITGSLLYSITQEPTSFLLGVVVAQIDPISVARLLNKEKSRLSVRAKAILGTWSSLDDPVTVLIAMFVSSLLLLPAYDTVSNTYALLGIEYFKFLSLNLLLCFCAYLLYRLLRQSIINTYIILFLSFVSAITYRLMFAIAIIGLFLRPKQDALVRTLVQIAFYAALVIIGIIIADGVILGLALKLAICAFLSQVIVGSMLSYELPRNDRIHLAFAQQNGITAIQSCPICRPLI
jgi:NhaP-type Na+/H+ or K+/H+ antiporter